MNKIVKFIAYSIITIVVFVFLQSTVFSSHSEKYKTTKLNKEKIKKEQNYRVLRRRAIDSLIENKIATPENFEKIRKMYPDSLCKC